MAHRTDEEAIVIYQRLLDAINDCYLTRDFETFSTMVHVPHYFRTNNDNFVLRDWDEMRDLFNRYLDHIEQQGMTNYIRRCTSASFKTRDRIEGTHESHMIKGANHVTPPFSATSMLMRIGKRWLVCASDNRIDETSAVGLALRQALRTTAGQKADEDT